MENEVAVINTELITNLVLNGDISKMNDAQKVQYYDQLCKSLNLNPATQPFQIIKFQGKEKLYATKDCTEQLRKLNGVSVVDMDTKIEKDIIITKVKVQDKSGRIDISTGAVNIKGLTGDALANATMKSETKAKRRATLSICGLGMLDEAELDTMPKFEGGAVDNKNNTDVDMTEERKKQAKEQYDKFWNSLDDGYKFELKDMQERDRFILFNKCGFDIKKLDDEIAKMAKENAESPFKNNDENIPF